MVQSLTCGKIGNDFSVHIVSNAHGDGLHIGKHIHFGQRQHICALNPHAVARGDGVKSAHSSGSAGCGTIFSPCFPQSMGFVSEHFHGEGAFTHAGRIGFHNADGQIQLVVGHACTHRAVGRDGGRGRGIRIYAEINVPQGTQLCLQHHPFSFLQGVVQIHRCVTDEGTKGISVGMQPL